MQDWAGHSRARPLRYPLFHKSVRARDSCKSSDFYWTVANRQDSYLKLVEMWLVRPWYRIGSPPSIHFCKTHGLKSQCNRKLYRHSSLSVTYSSPFSSRKTRFLVPRNNPQLSILQYRSSLSSNFTKTLIIRTTRKKAHLIHLWVCAIFEGVLGKGRYAN